MCFPIPRSEVFTIDLVSTRKISLTPRHEALVQAAHARLRDSISQVLTGAVPREDRVAAVAAVVLETYSLTCLVVARRKKNRRARNQKRETTLRCLWLCHSKKPLKA